MRHYRNVIGVLATAVCCMYLSCVAHAAPATCRISHLEGVVAARDTKDAEWKDAELGQLLPQGAQVITHKEAVCELSVGDANALRVEADALVTVTSLDPILIDISKGKLYALVRKLKQDSTFQVRTPTCVAAARGTGWRQSAEAVEVFESTVNVKNKGGQEQDVETGRGIGLDTNTGAFGKSYQLPPEAMAEWKSISNNMFLHLKDIVLTQASPAVAVQAPQASAPKKLVGSADRTGAVHGAIGDIRMLMQRIEAKYRPFEEKIQDEVAEYDTNTEGVSMALKIMRKAEKFRGDTNMVVPGENGEPGMTMNITMIYDGTNYWSITPMGAMKVPAGQVERHMQASAHWWNYLSERDKFAGEGEAEGRSCYVVDFEPGKALSYTRVWIDKENFRLIQALGPQDGHMYRFTFSDYRNVQGMDLPFKMQMYEDSRLVGEYNTRSMQFNVGLDDSLFAVNASAGGTNIQEMMRRAMRESGEDGGQ